MFALQSKASNPDTPSAELVSLAAAHPQLRPVIALNPSTQADLLLWLESLDDPAVTMALRQREAHIQAETRKFAGPQRLSVKGRGVVREEAAFAAPLRVAPTEISLPDTSETPAVQPAKSQGGNVSAADAAWARLAGPTRQAPAVQEEEDTKRPAWPVLLLVFLLVAVVLGALSYLLLRDKPSAGHNPAEQVPTPPSQTEEKPAQSTEEKDEDENKEDWEYPAPDSALTMSSFALPSGNILCEFTGDVVTCTVLDHTFANSGLADCGSGPATLRVSDEFAGLYCGTEPVTSGGGSTLSYGDYAEYGEDACQANEGGLSCWNQRTGKGFALARQGYITGLTGPIPAEEYPWE